jgi:hypothetical protein
MFAAWTKNGVYFVTHLKKNADYSVIKDFDVPKKRNMGLFVQNRKISENFFEPLVHRLLQRKSTSTFSVKIS